MLHLNDITERLGQLLQLEPACHIEPPDYKCLQEHVYTDYCIYPDFLVEVYGRGFKGAAAITVTVVLRCQRLRCGRKCQERKAPELNINVEDRPPRDAAPGSDHDADWSRVAERLAG